jgi:Zn-dependent M28 family amino/carboxypeptidase
VDNEYPLLVMEREEAQRAMRLLRAGKKLSLTAKIDVQVGGPYESYNVIGEIRGSREPEEIVVIGAHLDSWGLGAGANDNACNVAMMIDIARQMKKLGIVPKRTIRFALWNGEEQGFIGSWRYTQAHEAELDRHVMALSVDIGSGRINGFFTGGRGEQLPILERSLKSVQGLGPFASINVPVVGTDNYDFMMQGIVNLVANHEPHNYGPTYHAESDTFDKVDLRQLRLNAAIVAAVAYGYATLDIGWERQSRADLEELMRSSDLGEQMRSMGLWDSWEARQRGRSN